MKNAGKILGWLGLGALGTVGVILLVVTIWALATAFTAVIVALVWNWCGLHSVFHAGALTFWQVVGVAAAIGLVRGLFRRSNMSVERN